MENLNFIKVKGYENALKNAVPFPQHYYQQAPAPAPLPPTPNPKNGNNMLQAIVVFGVVIVGGYFFYKKVMVDDEPERKSVSKNKYK